MQTITKVYKSYKQAQKAVDALENAGISKSKISILATRESFDMARNLHDSYQGTDAAVGAEVGGTIGGAAGLLTGLGVMAIPGLGPVVAAGWLAATALGVIAGGAAGGIVGSLIQSGVPEDHAEVYSEAVRRGGTLVSVQAEDQKAETVQMILNTFTPFDPVQQAAVYRETGWDRFDPMADPYDSTTAASERQQPYV